MPEGPSAEKRPELAPLPNISGADFRIFEKYAEIDPNLKAQIEALPSFAEQDKYMIRLAEKLGKDPDTKITDISQLGMAPPPLPTGEDAKKTRVFEAVKPRPASGTRAKNGAVYRGPEAQTAPLSAAKPKQPERGDDAKTLARPVAGRRGPPPVPTAGDEKTRVMLKNHDNEPTQVLEEINETDLEVLDDKAAAELAAAIKKFNGGK